MQLAHKVLLARKALQVVHKALPVLPVPLVPPDLLVPPVIQVVHKVLQVLPVLKVLLAHKVFQAPQVQLARKVFRESPVLLVL